MIEVICIIVAITALFFWVEYINGSHDSSAEHSKLDISFNGEKIHGLGVFIDRRTDEQKARNVKEGYLDGDIIIFLQGHGQQPKYGFNFTSLLAERSRSGIVFIPHVYTPFGSERKWRGDKGKLVLLMELTRFCLEKKGLHIANVNSICELPVKIKDNKTPLKSGQSDISIVCEITVVGWSHGGLLARRFANAYPESVNNLAQVTPAGFESWGPKSWAGLNLFVNFMVEVGFISLMMFKGHVKQPLIAGVAIVRGIMSDSLYAFVSLVRSRSFSPVKLARAYVDIQQCSTLMTDKNMPVTELSNIVVLFGEKDSVFEAKNALKEIDINTDSNSSNVLFEKFFPSAVANGTRCSFKVLPGNHIAPLIHAERYVEEVLLGTAQRA